MSSTIVWIQKWEESEAGWGTRPDGYTIHARKEDITAFLDRMRLQEASAGFGPDNVPETYSRPCGRPYQAEITEAVTLAKLSSSEHGIWGPNGNRYPEPIFPEDKAGQTSL